MYSRIYQSPVGLIEIICDHDYVRSIKFVHHSKPTHKEENELCLRTEKQLHDYFEGKKELLTFLSSLKELLFKIRYGKNSVKFPMAKLGPIRN